MVWMKIHDRKIVTVASASCVPVRLPPSPTRFGHDRRGDGERGQHRENQNGEASLVVLRGVVANVLDGRACHQDVGEHQIEGDPGIPAQDNSDVRHLDRDNAKVTATPTQTRRRTLPRM